MNIDIFDNIVKQICDIKNFEQSKSNLYLTYCNYYGNNTSSPRSNKYYCEYNTESHFFICLLDILKDIYDKKEIQFDLYDFTNSPEIDINVITVSRRNYQFKVSPSHPIGHIKHLMTEKTGIEEELQVCIRCEKVLANDLTLNDCNIQHGDSLHCVTFIHF